MTFRKVLKWPSKDLNIKSTSASVEDDDDVIKDLVDTFRVIGGYGLSAPQIGLQKRIIVVNELALTGIEGSPKERVLINPVITSFDNLTTFEEACFSIDRAVLEINRYENVNVSYDSIDGKQEELKANGYYAACIQHEIDHLDGILMIDKLSHLKKSMFLKKQRKLKLKKKRFKESLKTKDEPRPGFRKKKQNDR